MTPTRPEGTPLYSADLSAERLDALKPFFLMTTKPDGAGALLAMAAAVVAGVAWAFSARPARQIHDLSTPAVQR